MLTHEQAHRRQLLHLPTLVALHRSGLVEGRLTRRAHGRAMLDHLVRGSYQMQCLAAVAQLPARLLAAAPALAARPLAPQRVARRWFAAVVAILGQARLQLLHACQKLVILRERLLQLGAQLGHQLVKFADAGICFHAPILRPQRKSVWTDPS